jgi:hypothetical protein
VCQNYMAISLSKGCNTLRSVDLCLCMHVSIVLVTVALGQVDKDRILGVCALVTTSMATWRLADEWNWILWATQRVRRGTTTAISKPSAAMRILPSLVGCILLLFAWILNWDAWSNASLAVVIVDDRLVRLPSSMAWLVVVPAGVSQLSIVFV